MNAHNLLLLRPDENGAPAALVATWLLDRLSDVDDEVDVRVIDFNTIAVDLPDGHDHGGVGVPVADLLTDPRFIGWSLRADLEPETRPDAPEPNLRWDEAR